MASFFCDRSTTEAFADLFTELFRVVKRLTRSELKFKVFSPNDDTAQMLAILVDAEIAQIKGLGQALVVHVG